MKIVVSGSIAFDYLMRFPGRFREHLIEGKLDRISVSFLVETLVRERGGSGANIAYNLALLGERPILMGTAGVDFADYRAWLDVNGVDTSAVRIIPDVFTASFFVNTDSDSNQIGSFFTGAMAHSRGYRLAEAVSGKPDLVVVAPNDPVAIVRAGQRVLAERRAVFVRSEPAGDLARRRFPAAWHRAVQHVDRQRVRVGDDCQ